MSKRLEILKNSLLKKEQLFSSKLQAHMDSVKQANGQPLNDKRNGHATMNRWERQNDALRTLKKSIEKTKEAIGNEEFKIYCVDSTNEIIPIEILNMVESGQLTQWRRHPNMFFVKGVDKARIIWDDKRKVVAHRYTDAITDKDQWRLFAKTFNQLASVLNNPPN